MKFSIIVLTALAFASCKSADSASDLEAKPPASPTQKHRIFTQSDYREIQSKVVMDPANQKRVSSDLCYGPAIAAWVDLVMRNSSRMNEREPTQFKIKNIAYYANLETVNIVDSKSMNYMVHAGGAGECTASNARGPIDSKDILTD